MFEAKKPIRILSWTYDKKFAGSSDKEQLTYTEKRLQDLQNVKEVKNINPILRVITGDNQQGSLKADSQGEESLVVYVVFKQVNTQLHHLLHYWTTNVERKKKAC